jgi:hypothetical protein
VAFVVARGIGLESNRAASDYIALYKGDDKTLAGSLQAIQETASRILKDLLPEDRAWNRSAPAVGPAQTGETRTLNHGPSEPERLQDPPAPDPALSWDR